MNKLLKKIAYIGCISAVFFTTSCNDIYNEVKTLQTDRLFRPINFAAALNKTQVTFTWAAVDSAASYTLQVSTDSLDYSAPVLDKTITDLKYVQEFAGATQFYARIRANASTETKTSKFNNTLSFKTPAENIFNGYTTLMTALNEITVKWTPAANVTQLVLKASDNTTKTVQLSASDISSGTKVITSLSNSNYTVQIYNNNVVRGAVSVVVEGDVYLPAGTDLLAAITSATAGQIIVLEPGALYLMGSSTYRLSQNVKVRGLLPTNLPVLAMTSGTATATSSMLGFVDGSSIGSVTFENIDFTGYCENNTANVKIGYLFNNNVLTTVGSLSFNNCKLRNFGNTPMRLQGSKNQVIDVLTFSNCTIYDIGFSSTYAIVNSNSADLINTINFTNCTAYNFKGSLVLRTGQTLKSVNITNCTINQGMQDPSSARYLIDLNTAVFSGSGVTIKNCIFGSTGAALGANGIRYASGTPVSITGSYYTSDYVDDPVPVGATSTSIKSSMTLYSGASTALWNAPLTGDFTLKDTKFAGKTVAGDLRWY